MSKIISIGTAVPAFKHAQNDILQFMQQVYAFDAVRNCIENHILMIGDAAGMITSLCGNGMSTALHGSKLAFENISSFLQNKISRTEMEVTYTRQWKQQFDGRIKTGRIIQRFFGKSMITNWFIKVFGAFPSLATPLIKQTHGHPF